MALHSVGIYGASAGGQSALNALLFHPDFYRAAVAYAGCYDNRMDKISWNEQRLGWPVDASYAAASGVDNAAKLQGQLLLIVGEQDSNVDPASTMQVVEKDSLSPFATSARSCRGGVRVIEIVLHPCISRSMRTRGRQRCIHILRPSLQEQGNSPGGATSDS